MSQHDLQRHFRHRFSGRKLTLLGMILILLLCGWWMGKPTEQAPWERGDWYEHTLKPFITAAWQPSFTDQSTSLPDDATPFLQRIGKELLNTVRYALVAMSLAVPLGLLLGFFASTAWWPDRGGRHWLMRPIHTLARLIITLMRSIHELIWALLFVAAIGAEPITACVALALPFGGTLAKVFSELIDEQNRQARNHLTASGAKPLHAFLASQLPQSMPDMATYTLYRFECALRSSAVLGFIGIETLGLSIKRSFENNFYNELWTELYLLLIVIVSVDLLGAILRKKLNTAAPSRARNNNTLTELRKRAPRWKTTRLCGWATLILLIGAWFPQLAGINADPLTREPIGKSRSERMEIFVKKITPQPVRESSEWADAIPWAGELWDNRGRVATANTLAMATAAIILAGFGAWLFLPWASRALANRHPLAVPNPRRSRLADAAWKAFGFSARSLFILTRAIPEYIYAFLLIGMLGISAWPLVLALALHNFGILGRLWGEVMENHPPGNARQLIAHGGSRWQSYLGSFIPECFNRFLIYIFYRWETCVREATVLGMLGVASLGYEIQISRLFSREYDAMLYFVLLGAALIIIGDLFSLAIRKKLRSV